MELSSGTRLESTTCDTQVAVVRVPADAGDVDLRCGGQPMVPVGEAGDKGEATIEGEATLMGKRYVDADDTIEVLCTKPGDNPLSIGDAVLTVKGAKPLPSSD